MLVLKAEDLRKYYGEGDCVVKALDGVSLEVEQGEFIAVVGSSGSGKSTLLHLLGGLDRETSGSLVVRGNRIFELEEEELTIFRRRNIGFVFQDYNLVPILNVYENIVLPLELDGSQVDREYIDEILKHLGLHDLQERMPAHLSGGQRQRVAMARALAPRPAIILADEPTGNLDSRTGMEVVGLLKSTGKRFSQTILMITHNEDISLLADRILRIEDGLIVEGN